MARSWIVLTADRSPHAANEIIAYTEWDGYVALADEVVYTDPVDVDGNAVDGLWKVGGSVVLVAGVYTYNDPGTEPTLADRQRGQIFDAYLYWRVFGRTGHWAGLREHQKVTTFEPLHSVDKWALHILALVDQAIHGLFPITGAYTPAALQAFIDHAEVILRTLGPTWYLAQIQAPPAQNAGEPTDESTMYRELSVADGTAIYTDIVTVLGVLRVIDGEFLPMSVNIRVGFNPESRSLGN